MVTAALFLEVADESQRKEVNTTLFSIALYLFDVFSCSTARGGLKQGTGPEFVLICT